MIFFNTAYSGSNPHSCTGENRVLSLYKNFNSHASSAHDTVYNYDVCYGDLNCNYDTSSGPTCANNGKVVARMASNSNSHISEASGNYPVKICCISTFANTPYWADMNGKRITHADFGDTVQMIAPPSFSGDFYIKDSRFILPDYDVKTISGNIVGSKMVGVWTITNADLSKVGNNDYSQFYFKVGSKKSKYLDIGKNGHDIPMNITIENPHCGEYFNANSNVKITINAKDADDLIKGVVKINGVRGKISPME